MKLNANVFSVITLLLCLASQPTHADSILATLNYWTAGTTTGNQASNASFKGGATADGGKSFATTFTAEQKIDVLTYIRVATDHVGKTGGLYMVAHYNNAWFMKVSDGQWQPWNSRIPDLVSYAGPRPLAAMENIQVAEQLSGLVGSFDVYIGYKIDGDIHYNAQPFSFTVKEKPAPVVPANVVPIADAGVDKDINEHTQVTLDGSKSRDSDGSIVKYLWEQTGGTTAKLDNLVGAKLTFTAPEVTRAEDLKFKLMVTDNQGATASDTVMVIVRDVSVSNSPTVIPVSVAPLPNLISQHFVELRGRAGHQGYFPLFSSPNAGPAKLQIETSLNTQSLSVSIMAQSGNTNVTPTKSYTTDSNILWEADLNLPSMPLSYALP